MSDASSNLLLNGVHVFLVSCAWVLLFMALILLVACCFRAAVRGPGRAHPLVWVLGGLLMSAILLIVWTKTQPDLAWGLLGLGSPFVAVVSAVFRPRARRLRSGY